MGFGGFGFIGYKRPVLFCMNQSLRLLALTIRRVAREPRALTPQHRVGCTIGALATNENRVWGILYYNHNKEPPKIVWVITKAPIVGLQYAKARKIMITNMHYTRTVYV